MSNDNSSPVVLLTATNGSTVKLQLKYNDTATYTIDGNIWHPVAAAEDGGTFVAGNGISINGNTISSTSTVEWEDLRG